MSRSFTNLAFGLDEVFSKFDFRAHEFIKYSVGFLGIVDPDLNQDPFFWIHRRIKQLLGIHLAQPL